MHSVKGEDGHARWTTSEAGKQGLIAPGYAADLVVFDPDRISDKATYHDPKRFPEGISHVLVNGTQTIASGVHRGARAGRAIEGRCS